MNTTNNNRKMDMDFIIKDMYGMTSDDLDVIVRFVDEEQILTEKGTKTECEFTSLVANHLGIRDITQEKSNKSGTTNSLAICHFATNDITMLEFKPNHRFPNETLIIRVNNRYPLVDGKREREHEDGYINHSIIHIIRSYQTIKERQSCVSEMFLGSNDNTRLMLQYTTSSFYNKYKSQNSSLRTFRTKET